MHRQGEALHDASMDGESFRKPGPRTIGNCIRHGLAKLDLTAPLGITMSGSKAMASLEWPLPVALPAPARSIRMTMPPRSRIAFASLGSDIVDGNEKIAKAVERELLQFIDPQIDPQILADHLPAELGAEELHELTGLGGRFAGRGLQATVTTPSFASISFRTTDRITGIEPVNEPMTIWSVVLPARDLCRASEGQSSQRGCDITKP